MSLFAFSREAIFVPDLILLVIPLFTYTILFVKRDLAKDTDVNTFIWLMSTLTVFLAYASYFFNPTMIYSLGNWFSIGYFVVDFNFVFDPLTKTMLLLITTITWFVQLFSMGYMKDDPEYPRFMAELFLFEFFMLVLVTAGNFPILFLGWEGVGLMSFFLVNFWHTRIASNKAAIKAVIVNKVGDVALMLAIAAIFYTFKTIDFPVLFAILDSLNNVLPITTISDLQSQIDFIAIFLLLAATAKSAQLGLHTWLPDAMEGPSPVSALIHAATMVTAGIFLIVRCSPLFELSQLGLNACVILGTSTAFFASTVALVQNDIKRVIAFSTCSQLGYMLMACGLSGYNFAMFHLFNHGFFKALLFLAAGSIIHAVLDEQDMRRFGGLVNFLPLTYIATFIGSLSLIGFPYSTGYYSKDAILELAFASHSPYAKFAYIFGTLSACLTAFYSMRLLYLSYLAKPNFYRAAIPHIHDAPWEMAIPLVFLSIAGSFVGYRFNDLFIGLGTSFWENSIFSQHTEGIFDFENIPTFFKLLPVLLSIAAGFYAYILYNKYYQTLVNFNLTDKATTIYKLFSYKWYWDILYNYFLVYPVMFLGQRVTFEILDRGAFELFGPLGIVRFINTTITRVSKLQSGFMYHYIFMLLVGLILLLIPVLTISLNWQTYSFLDSNYLVVIAVLLLNPTLYFKLIDDLTKPCK